MCLLQATNTPSPSPEAQPFGAEHKPPPVVQHPMPGEPLQVEHSTFQEGLLYGIKQHAHVVHRFSDLLLSKHNAN